MNPTTQNTLAKILKAKKLKEEMQRKEAEAKLPPVSEYKLLASLLL
jgi:hypothetical protein